MVIPDYDGGSILNITSSIEKSQGKRPLHEELRLLPAKALSKKRIIFILIDGLGYDLVSIFRKSIMYKNLRGKMTSVFPSTTSAAITSITTGCQPCEHAITGWFMNMKEFGGVVRFLPFDMRCGGFSLNRLSKIDGFLPASVGKRIGAYCAVHPASIAGSPYNKATTKNAVRRKYSTLDGFFRHIRMDQHKVQYAYWPILDSICHKHGKNSMQAFLHFAELDAHLQKLARNVKDATVIITGDHGHIDCKTLFLNNYPEMEEMLSIPLCGEARAAFCYVKANRAKDFERFVANKLHEVCELHKSEHLIKKGYYGNGEKNKALYDRVGDYTLLMKGNHALVDRIAGETKKTNIGYHGGISEEEMHVPLIVLDL